MSSVPKREDPAAADDARCAETSKPRRNRVGPLSYPLRRKDPAAGAKLDVAYFYSRMEGQFNFLSHVLRCTEDATLTINATECGEDLI